MRGGSELRWETLRILIMLYMTRDLGLSGTPLLVFACIHSFAQATGEAGVPMALLSFWTGKRATCLTEAVDELVGRGLVERRGRGEHGEARYRLTPEALDPERRASAAGGSANAAITLYGFYVTRLGLTGVDLITYAAVAELCGYEGARCEAPLAWLASWYGGSVSTARRSLRRLAERGLVERRDPAEPGGPCSWSMGPGALTSERLIDLGLSAMDGGAPARRARPADDRWDDFQRLRNVVNNTEGFDFGWADYRALRDSGRGAEEVEAAVAEAAEEQRRRHPGREERYFPHCQRTVNQAARILSKRDGARGRAAAGRRAQGAPAGAAEFRRSAPDAAGRRDLIAVLPGGGHVLLGRWREGMGEEEMTAMLEATPEWAARVRGEGRA